MRSRTFKKLLAALGLLALGSLSAQAEVSGEMAAQTCAGCHGTQGYISDSAFMPLAGMDQAQFIQAMKSFADGSRPGTLMGPIAAGFSDAEIRAMAEYFAQFPKERGGPQ
ncbi:MAG: c-type cytochrome [Halothiobacillaceae bacterium]